MSKSPYVSDRDKAVTDLLASVQVFIDNPSTINLERANANMKELQTLLARQYLLIRNI